ncbi:MAG: ABC transporter ATP-binding protein [Aureliella sp.]
MSNLVVQGLCKSFENAAEKLEVLDGVDLELKEGENLSIVGPSGCGKSTLLYILGTLDTPTGGEVSLDGVKPFQLAPQKLAAFRNKSIGFIFQDHHLLPQLSIEENVLLPAMASAKPTSDQVERCNDLIEAVGLADRKTHLPGQLSGGQRQRVAVARALVNRPKLLLADEPTGNLDEENTKKIANLMFELTKRENATLIVVTHSLWLAEQADRQTKLADKRLVDATSVEG